MNLIFLTQVKGILKPFAWIMGKILNAIYLLVNAIGIPNIALCIVLFTIVVKMLMLPLTIKQQKFAKVSSLMSPEIKALQEKYRGIDRSDRAAMQRFTEEQQDIYRKYGSSPFGGCLPLLIMFPIIFALYRVIYAVPAYVTDIKAMYENVAQEITTLDERDTSFSDESITKAIYQFYNAKGVSLRESKTTEVNFKNIDLIDIFSAFKTADWEDFRNGAQLEGDNVEEWNRLAASQAFKDSMSNVKTDTINGQSENIDKILKVNSLFKYSILDAPGIKFPLVILPILAFLLQYISGKISTTQTKKKDGEPDAVPGLGMMNTILPVMSGVFCIFMPIGVGIYWVVNSGVTIAQQVAINKYLDKYDISDIVAQNEAKIAERNEKLGIYSKNEGMSGIAKASTKSIASLDTSKIGGKKSGGSQDKRSEGNGKVSQKKKDEISKKAAENNGVVGIAAIANIMKNDEDQ